VGPEQDSVVPRRVAARMGGPQRGAHLVLFEGQGSCSIDERRQFAGCVYLKRLGFRLTLELGLASRPYLITPERCPRSQPGKKSASSEDRSPASITSRVGMSPPHGTPAASADYTAALLLVVHVLLLLVVTVCAADKWGKPGGETTPRTERRSNSSEPIHAKGGGSRHSARA
jgi:hypothetical protein